MKPGDHPDFYRFAPPSGTSRESTIVLDREGRFWHDGEPVDHRALALALHRWIARHPDDGRLILTNGYDWCYFKADDTPYFVLSLALGEAPTMVLSDESSEPLEADKLSVGEDGVVYARVKGAAFDARFSRHAQTALGPVLVAADPPTVEIAGVQRVLPRRSAPTSIDTAR